MVAVPHVIALLLLTVPPPPIGDGSIPVIVSFDPSPTLCFGGTQRPVHIEPPLPVAAFADRTATANTFGEVIVRFRIDASGRPLTISSERIGRNEWVDTSDVEPAVAAWRFAAGPQRTECMVKFTLSPHAPIDAASEVLARYVAGPEGGQSFNMPGTAGEIAYRTLAPAGATCFGEPRVGVRTWTYPETERVPEVPGGMSYSQIVYDLDRGGRPVRVRTGASSGNATWDRRTRTAIAKSRFRPGDRKGCSYIYGHWSDRPMDAPDPPDMERLRARDATCPRDRPGWVSQPALVFPEPFRRRSIEGWAVVRYDVASWGEVGNVAAMEAEPAASFGEEAVRIVRQARMPRSSQGYSGCLDLVRFVIAPPK